MRPSRDLIILIALLLLVHAALAGAGWWMQKHYLVASPHLYWGLVAIPALSVWYVWRRNRRVPRATLPTVRSFVQGPFDWKARLRHLPFVAVLGGLGMLLLSMTRPQSSHEGSDITVEGIDIMIAMDFSASMLAKDFKPDRLEAARTMALRFIDGRPNDRIGLVVYEGEAFTQCPLTTDHDVLKDLFMKARSGMIEGGTAVGMGLATAINRLRESTRKSRVIILMTDGVNNRGMIQPLDAARIAQQYGIRVYTIGVGSRGKALSPVAQGPNGQYQYAYVDVEIDDDMMKQVADLTGGTYFRATDEGKLKDVYEQIDKLEKTREKITRYSRHSDKYFKPLFAGCSLLVLGLLLDKTLFRTTP
ncbi:MAG: VWA domain-containing protein [Bacteroidetes bacterium]|jgi:Ca-activated chloride channel family protein|nr:VWA domain-containing protein [Bacteroidota bacterium]MBX7129151.1 VWA domain-containing protein [Flavobacteriales bacterium]MCC6655272.1 VWA domain-containing protein [Flavobacteriales bacterium]HMU13679.1 VWA domain-containing protein [Flavobacteriales bacterium]HMW96058.1 VWA domain-containing protein [Flavobacteriales bacterium]